jgi:23S rRNA (guanosine2251-2'-O)-methyltransferase
VTPQPNRGLAIGGRRAVVEALGSGNANGVVVAAGSRRNDSLREVLEEARRMDVPLEWVDADVLDRLEVRDHQGVVAFVKPPRELDERSLTAMPFDRDALVVVLDGITDPQNLGAAARCAEAAGVRLMIARRRRAAPVSGAAIRASAGALLHLPLARVPNIPRALAHLKRSGFLVVGLDHRAVRTIHDGAAPGRPLALVVGSEDRGISRLVREACDDLVSIPMSGRISSLNASAALAVGLFGYALRPGGP